MRFWMMAAISAVALGAAGPAAAQGYGAPIPAPGGATYGPPPQQYGAPPPFVAQQAPQGQVPTAGPRVWQDGRWMALPPSRNIARLNDPNRWGYEIEGQWYGGTQAPGGWGAYRRLGRGHQMPGYWMQGAFGIPDYLSFGLSAPPRGYRWIRYYNDAVLVDDRGNVWDTVGGIAWAGAGAYAGGSHSSSSSYSYSSAGAAIQPVDPNLYYGQQQYQGGYAPPAAYGPPAVQQGYGANYGASYMQGSYYYGAPVTSSSVIVIPTTTTTTIVEEEIIEETVVTTSYVRATPRRVVRRAAPPKRAKPRPACCRCVCR
ncbi:RcnB family protein [Sphingomonas soli]|uniref:RcnB family protein n=1 Tax=Sphingomonas soli TaxID=266127 RepID=UPI0008318F4E|nr:RcnB family protein [Sphingomonas soli]